MAIPQAVGVRVSGSRYGSYLDSERGNFNKIFGFIC